MSSTPLKSSSKSWKYAAFGAVFVPFAAQAGGIPTAPPVN
jgi:hypothetical protein